MGITGNFRTKVRSFLFFLSLLIFLKKAENVAKVYNITREEQDKFALSSQLKYKNAYENNHFKNEIGI